MEASEAGVGVTAGSWRSGVGGRGGEGRLSMQLHGRYSPRAYMPVSFLRTRTPGFIPSLYSYFCCFLSGRKNNPTCLCLHPFYFLSPPVLNFRFSGALFVYPLQYFRAPFSLVRLQYNDLQSSAPCLKGIIKPSRQNGIRPVAVPTPTKQKYLRQDQI